MSVGEASSLMRGALFEILLLAAPILVVAMVIGLIVSILQATTSIQEQTLSFVPKIVAVLLVLAFLGSWMFSHVGQYTRHIFEMIPAMAR